MAASKEVGDAQQETETSKGQYSPTQWVLRKYGENQQMLRGRQCCPTDTEISAEYPG